jgi:signal transduction histidine kinase
VRKGTQDSLVASKYRVSNLDLDLDVDVDLDGLVQGKLLRNSIQQIILYRLISTSKSTPGSRSRADEYGVSRRKLANLVIHRAAAHRAVLEVEDNGTGISQDALSHIFARFYRADKERSRRMGGARLGLSIVQAICLARGGEVRVESTEGRGSRFSVILPLANQKG